MAEALTQQHHRWDYRAIKTKDKTYLKFLETKATIK